MPFVFGAGAVGEGEASGIQFVAVLHTEALNILSSCCAYRVHTVDLSVMVALASHLWLTASGQTRRFTANGRQLKMCTSRF